MKVQIITPTVGSEDLVDALLSVHHQTSDMDLEIRHMVVIDGPEFQEVVDARIVEAEKQNYSRDNLQVMTLPYNTGGKGFYGHKIYAAATQLLLPDVDYVLFLDQDNWYEPNHVDSVVRKAVLGGLDFSFSLRKFYTWDGEYHSDDNCASLGPWKIWDNGGHNLVDTGCYCFKREFIEKRGHLWNMGWGVDINFFESVMSTAVYQTTGERTFCYRLGRPEMAKYDEEMHFIESNNALAARKYGGNYPWEQVN